MTEDLDSVVQRLPKRTVPRIACLRGEESSQYFLIVEEKVLFHVSELSRALMYWFSLHYVLNLEYCKHVKFFALYLQEFVFGLPATSLTKLQKSVGYLTITTDLQNYV